LKLVSYWKTIKSGSHRNWWLYY